MEGTVVNADSDQVASFTSPDNAESACSLSADCKGVWQMVGTLQYYLLDTVGGSRTWTGTDSAGSAKPRNPRHFDRIEGGRKRGLDIFLSLLFK